MSDPNDDATFEKQIREELDRIGVGGLEMGGAATPRQVLAALRLTADGAGGHALFTNLSAILKRANEE